MAASVVGGIIGSTVAGLVGLYVKEEIIVAQYMTFLGATHKMSSNYKGSGLNLGVDPIDMKVAKIAGLAIMAIGCWFSGVGAYKIVVGLLEASKAMCGAGVAQLVGGALIAAFGGVVFKFVDTPLDKRASSQEEAEPA